VGVYAENMDALTFPLPNQLYLVVATHAARSHMLDLAAHLALRGQVRILDAGNQCNIYPIAQRLRRSTADVNAALARIQVQRAFTCYQVAALLVETPPAAIPTLVMDLLSTFYDEDVKLPEATQLLHGCLRHLGRLAEQAPVLVSARPPAPVCAERVGLLELLRATAAQHWEAEEAPASQRDRGQGELFAGEKPANSSPGLEFPPRGEKTKRFGDFLPPLGAKNSHFFLLPSPKRGGAGGGVKFDDTLQRGKGPRAERGKEP
jgi:hypothetical protein